MADIGSFDSLNPILYKGETAGGLGLVYENLMADSLDEPSTSYGLIAEWASYPLDYSSVTFKLRDDARWHDGTKITPDDVIFSLEANKAANPRMGLYYKNVTRAEATGENEVTFYFDVKNNRELPMIMGQLTILPKHWWTGKDANGNQRDPMKTTLEPPLGSGPYRIKEVKPGRSIILRAGHGLLGQGSAGERRAVELRHDPLRILPRRDRRLRELQGGEPRLLAGDERQELGHGLRLRRRAQRLGQEAGGGARTHPADAVLRAQSQAPAICRPARAAGVQSRLRFRMGEQEPVLRAICAGRQLFPGRRARRAAEAAGGA